MEDKSQQGDGVDAWDATQWHVVEKGETLSKIAEQYRSRSNTMATPTCTRRSSRPTATS